MRKMDEYLVSMDTIYPDGYRRESLFRSSGDMLEAAPPAARGGNLMVRVARAISLWQRRRSSRLVLRDLDDDLLRDVGLTRIQADAEVCRSRYLGRPSSF